MHRQSKSGSSRMDLSTSKWKKELDSLVRKTGVTLQDVCEYIGIEYNNKAVGFYKKIPKKREMFIGIGMAFRQELSVINGWISGYGGKKSLYSKDVLSDLIWIYLINCNHSNQNPDVNYYKLYDECREAVRQTYDEIWDEYTTGTLDTVVIDSKLETVGPDPAFEGIRAFVAENMDSFKTAYAKPRGMLATYVNTILGTYSQANDGIATPINFLRGYLDDSMINYITGSADSINAMDMKTRSKNANVKAVPKLKKTHIAICLALGMAEDEINSYLELMGFLPLDENDKDEGALVEMLAVWESEHPLTRAYKNIYELVRDENAVDTAELSAREELQAVSDMLMLRNDLDYEYMKKGLEFPYLKD